MKTRADAVALINRQLDEEKPAGGCYHYGLLELRELMDYIYEGLPASKAEMLINIHRKRRWP
jgi:hypothetical protein